MIVAPLAEKVRKLFLPHHTRFIYNAAQNESSPKIMYFKIHSDF